MREVWDFIMTDFRNLEGCLPTESLLKASYNFDSLKGRLDMLMGFVFGIGTCAGDLQH